MGLITEILKRPSQRTQMEATMAGLSVLLFTSLATPIYIIFLSESGLFLKILSGFGGVALFIMMLSNLSMIYIQYHSYKKAMGMYSVSQQIFNKMEDAKIINKELKDMIREFKKNETKNRQKKKSS